MGLFDGIVGSVIGGAASIFGASSQNSSAKKIADQNNQMSIELANTAHQREVKDLRDAGLNPILSAHGAGAATPGMQAAPVENEIEGAVSSASKASQLSEALKNLEADTEQKTEAAKLSKEQQVVSREQAQQIMADYWKKDAEKRLLWAQTATAVEQAGLLNAQKRSAQVEANINETTGGYHKLAGSVASSASALSDIVTAPKKAGMFGAKVAKKFYNHLKR